MDRERTVITLGNFDGVHLGHQALVRTARQIAEPLDAAVVALSFQRHPLTVLRPEQAPPALSHPGQRRQALLTAGADQVEWLDPTPDLLGMAPEQFINWLLDRYQPVAMVEGANFHFGRNRAGDTQTLEKLGLELGFKVRTVEMLQVALSDKLIVPVSSSLIRWLIAQGRVADAHLCLGRPYQLQGTVVEGEKRGRTLQIPTANIETAPQLLPADGVYAATAYVHGKRYLAAMSVGIKPTFGGRRRVCEVHLLDFQGDLYGQTLQVDCHRWIRDQAPFPSVNALLRQLQDDLRQIRMLERAALLDPVPKAG